MNICPLCWEEIEEGDETVTPEGWDEDLEVHGECV